MRTFGRFNNIFLGENPLILGGYWQAAKDYKWRVLRLSILITILVILIVSTVPSTFLGTAILQFSPIKTVVTSDTYLPFEDTDIQQELENQYEKILIENIAKGVLIKLKKFSLRELDIELENAISKYVVISRIKQKVRAVLPFMPQEAPKALSSKQLRMLKTNYTLEQITQNLYLRHSPNQSKVYVEYKDQSATFAIIIAKLAADLYVQSVSETKMQMFEFVLQQFRLNNTKANSAPKPLDTIKSSHKKLQIPDLKRSIEFTLQDIKKLKRQVKDSNRRRQDMMFIRNKVSQYGLNIAPLLRHKQVTEHPLIQPFKRNVEIAELKLDDLTLSPKRVPSQVAVALEELMSVKKVLDNRLVLLASNVDLNYWKASQELNKYKTQLKDSQKKLQNLTRFQKELNQFPANTGNHQISELQKNLNQIASYAPIESTEIDIFIGNYTTKLLEPNRVLIVSLSFFLSILVISLLVLTLLRLKPIGRQDNPLVATQKEL